MNSYPETAVSESNFDKTVSRLDSGHFMVRLLFKQEATLLGNVTETCTLRALYRYKKSDDGNIGDLYVEFMH